MRLYIFFFKLGFSQRIALQYYYYYHNIIIGNIIIINVDNSTYKKRVKLFQSADKLDSRGRPGWVGGLGGAEYLTE